MSELIRLVFASRADFEIDSDNPGIDPTLSRIRLQSRRNNARLSLGGVLYYGDGCFLQCLEGPRDLVEPLAEEIERDPRHRDFKVLRKQAVAARRFFDWSMKFVALEGVVDDVLRRHELAEFDPYLFDDAIIDELLRLFAEAGSADAGAGDAAADAAQPAAPGWRERLRRLFG